MKSNISYNLFRNRKNFNPLVLFYQNKDLTYQEFKEYFNSRYVTSPDIEYYNRVKQAFLEKTKVTTKIEKVEDDLPEKELAVKTPKPKRKRRSKNENS